MYEAPAGSGHWTCTVDTDKAAFSIGAWVMAVWTMQCTNHVQVANGALEEVPPATPQQTGT